ncbi:MAG: hypothetical protein LC624_02915 [Halobacteriales archaeon]|nr:hypothetical protein [Halobacteriales archaeon]
MRALIALSFLAILAASGVAVADGLLPDSETFMKPVEQSGSLASDTTLALLGSASDTAVGAAAVYQSTFNGARDLISDLAVQQQDEFAACPAGAGWTSIVLPDSVSVANPYTPDVQPFAQGLAARVQAHPSILLDELTCIQAWLAPDLPL